MSSHGPIMARMIVVCNEEKKDMAFIYVRNSPRPLHFFDTTILITYLCEEQLCVGRDQESSNLGTLYESMTDS